jgi:hypothetical protein
MTIALELEALNMEPGEAGRVLSCPIPLGPWVGGSSAFLVGLISVFWLFHYLVAVLFCCAMVVAVGTWVIAMNRRKPRDTNDL